MTSKISNSQTHVLNTLIAVLLLTLFSGCSYFNETRFENSLGKDINLIKYSNDIADDLISSAYPPLIPRQQQMAILTTTFVNNNDLTQTSHFGRLIQENIGSRFVQLGYSVNEIKLRKNLFIEEKSGETILTRQLNLIKPTQKAQAVLAGTISQVQRTMYISARLVNPDTGAILSSNSYRLYMDQNVLAMFNLSVTSARGAEKGIEEPSEPLINKVFY